MSKLDKHYRCPKDLKTMFALTPGYHGFKRTLMEADFHAKHVERAVELRSGKATDERRPHRPQEKLAA